MYALIIHKCGISRSSAVGSVVYFGIITTTAVRWPTTATAISPPPPSHPYFKYISLGSAYHNQYLIGIVGLKAIYK